MAICEKCWARAYGRARDSGESQGEAYRKILEETELHPCRIDEQKLGHKINVQAIEHCIQVASGTINFDDLEAGHDALKELKQMLGIEE